MKIHEHAAASVCYAAGLAFLTGNNLAAPQLYAAALIGGIAIDVLDHSLYHLLYKRNSVEASELRELIRKGRLRSAIRRAQQLEQERRFVGLMLHNLIALFVVSLAALIGSLMVPGGPWIYCALGSMLLHMIMDISGDIKSVGHARNWTWCMPRKIMSPGDAAKHSAQGACVFLYFLTIASITFASLRWTLQMQSDVFASGLLVGAKAYGAQWIKYVPWSLFVFYFGNILALCWITKKRYELDGQAYKNMMHDEGSLESHETEDIDRFARSPKGPAENYRKFLLWAENHQMIFIGMTALLICAAVTSLGWINDESMRDAGLFIIPVSISMLVGTYIHTSIGEYGGLIGITGAWAVNIVLARLNIQAPWLIDMPVTLAVLIMTVWIFGLVGGVFLRGRVLMSISYVYIKLSRNESSREESNAPLRDCLISAIEDGYRLARKALYLENISKSVGPYCNEASKGGAWRPTQVIDPADCHIIAADTYPPIVRQLIYATCGDILDNVLPVMPRQKVPISDAGKAKNATIAAEYNSDQRTGYYRWRGKSSAQDWPAGPFRMPKKINRIGLAAPWSDCFDHFITRADKIRVDVFSEAYAMDENEICICMFGRDVTSTKEFITAESDIYLSNCANEVFKLWDTRTYEREIKYGWIRTEASYHDWNLFGARTRVDWTRDEQSHLKKYVELLLPGGNEAAYSLGNKALQSLIGTAITALMLYVLQEYISQYLGK